MLASAVSLFSVLRMLEACGEEGFKGSVLVHSCVSVLRGPSASAIASVPTWRPTWPTSHRAPTLAPSASERSAPSRYGVDRLTDSTPSSSLTDSGPLLLEAARGAARLWGSPTVLQGPEAPGALLRSRRPLLWHAGGLVSLLRRSILPAVLGRGSGGDPSFCGGGADTACRRCAAPGRHRSAGGKRVWAALRLT